MFGINPLWNFFDEEVRNHSYTINDNENAIVVTIDLPGVKESDLQVALENGMLSVRAQRKDGTRSYAYSWSIPESVNSEQVDAEYEDGVLTLTLPKQPQVKPRQIAIKAKKQIAEKASA